MEGDKKRHMKVENLTRKAHIQETELERTKKQLKEAITIAGEETAKCKAAREVIKSLTAQLKEMAKRLPVGAMRTARTPSFSSLVVNPSSPDLSSASLDQLNGQLASLRGNPDVFNNHLLTNGTNTPSTHSFAHQNRLVASESTLRNPGRTKEGESRQEHEWAEQDEPGVYITFVTLHGGVKDLKQVRFSRKRFSEKQAEQWWAENRARVYEQYKALDKSSAGVESEDQSSLFSWKASSVG